MQAAKKRQTMNVLRGIIVFQLIQKRKNNFFHLWTRQIVWYTWVLLLMKKQTFAIISYTRSLCKYPTNQDILNAILSSTKKFLYPRRPFQSLAHLWTLYIWLKRGIGRSWTARWRVFSFLSEKLQLAFVLCMKYYKHIIHLMIIWDLPSHILHLFVPWTCTFWAVLDGLLVLFLRIV